MNNEDKKKTFKEEMIDLIVEGLEKDGIQFVNSWISPYGTPESYISGGKYSGVNAIRLAIEANRKGYSDNRWLTFKQIRENNLHLNKGSKGVRVQFTMPYDNETEKIISWKQYKKLSASMDYIDKENRFSLRNKYYVVFNASNVIGVEPKKEIKLNNIQKEELIDRISSSLNVPIKEGGHIAAYSPKKDCIYIPNIEDFVSQGAYISVCLHELGHSTGHESRLNRNLDDNFGSENYAKEELIAELTSCFLGEYTQEKLDEQVLINHQQYVKAWLEELQNDKNYFHDAVKEAVKASHYIEEHAHLRDWKEELKEDVINQEEGLNQEELKEEVINQEEELNQEELKEEVINQEEGLNQEELKEEAINQEDKIEVAEDEFEF